MTDVRGLPSPRLGVGFTHLKKRLQNRDLDAPGFGNAPMDVGQRSLKRPAFFSVLTGDQKMCAFDSRVSVSQGWLARGVEADVSKYVHRKITHTTETSSRCANCSVDLGLCRSRGRSRDRDVGLPAHAQRLPKGLTAEQYRPQRRGIVATSSNSRLRAVLSRSSSSHHVGPHAGDIFPGPALNKRQ